MAIQLTPYLNFAGNGREAMTYYQGVFGGDLKLFGFNDMPADGLMHGELTGDGFTIVVGEHAVQFTGVADPTGNRGQLPARTPM